MAPVFSLGALFIDPIADQFGQANPPVIGWVVAIDSAAVLLAVDALDKHARWT